MRRLMLFALALALPITAFGDESEAKKLAQEILDKGSALFDQRDAAAMTATYADDADIVWIEKDNSTGEYKSNTKKGLAEIEGVYKDLFKDKNEKTTSKNTVEFARLIAPDLLVIEGLFQPNVANQGKYPFVQVRVKQGEKWLIKHLQLVIVSQD